MADPSRADKDPVQPWPRWARYLFCVVVIAIVAFGVVRIAQGGVPGTVLRVVLVVFGAGAVVALLQGLGTRRRTTRLAGNLVQRLEAARSQLDQEIAADPAQRASRAPDGQLHAASTAVASALEHLRAGDRARAAVVVEELGRTSRESWAPDAPATRELNDCARLARAMNAAQRARR